MNWQEMMAAFYSLIAKQKNAIKNEQLSSFSTLSPNVYGIRFYPEYYELGFYGAGNGMVWGLYDNSRQNIFASEYQIAQSKESYLAIMEEALHQSLEYIEKKRQEAKN